MEKTRVYYYNPFLTIEQLEYLQQNKCPLHSYYGLNYFDDDIELVIHKTKKSPSNKLIYRVLSNVKNALRFIYLYNKYDMVYITNSRGVKLIALLRALKFFPKPICMLIHWGVTIPNSKIKRFFSTLYIKGFDYLFFFSEELLEESRKAGIIKKAAVVHWGADLDFYKKYKPNEKMPTTPFLSTGTEKRDFSTLIKAFEKAKKSITLYLTERSTDKYSLSIVQKASGNNDLIHAFLLKEKIDLLSITMSAECIVIPLQPFAKNKIYPLGLTSLVEAMSLSRPVIVTDNYYNGIDVEEIGCGIKVGYGDVEGWANAIIFMEEHKELAHQMGEKGKEYVEAHDNLNIFGHELSEIFNEMAGHTNVTHS